MRYPALFRLVVPGLVVFAMGLGPRSRPALAGEDAPPPTGPKVDFARQIRPIFEAKCYTCHGPDKQQSNLRLDDKAAARLANARKSPPMVMPSMAVDLVAGNRLELPWLGGRVRELGRQHGIPTPASDFIWTALKPFLNGKAAGEVK